MLGACQDSAIISSLPPLEMKFTLPCTFTAHESTPVLHRTVTQVSSDYQLEKQHTRKCWLHRTVTGITLFSVEAKSNYSSVVRFIKNSLRDSGCSAVITAQKEPPFFQLVKVCRCILTVLVGTPCNHKDCTELHCKFWHRRNLWVVDLWNSLLYLRHRYRHQTPWQLWTQTKCRVNGWCAN
ncbi:hypothetical protein T4D_12155 [Trichinella pseudospiralis]|uniref:Uncharacterized protein n=1 Tax=Trichinella pseudospiralis TaxID=6337 RepID=A0A0V1F4M3_TRIPS|nr:hypothetical protein T4D_12155 [Trichinella pseudospiralis]